MYFKFRLGHAVLPRGEWNVNNNTLLSLNHFLQEKSTWRLVSVR